MKFNAKVILENELKQWTALEPKKLSQATLAY